MCRAGCVGQCPRSFDRSKLAPCIERAILVQSKKAHEVGKG